ncbi:hypothetical protein G9A89_020670 [Geosiphon pyriformis]|nr:hypothetical protein G9A89_020670 [Geosiphon pyriformis]
MKKVTKKSGFGESFKPVLSRKKRKDAALKKSVGGKGVLTKMPGGCSWDSKIDNTTKSESIDMEKECLVEKTSFDYDESETVADKNHDQTLKGPDIKTKKVLGKSLGKIDFLGHDNNDDDVLLDVLLELPPLLRNLVTVSVRKFFALDINLNKVVEKSSHKKLMIIHAFFTSESSLAQAIEKAKAVNILVNADLKKSIGYLNRAVVVKKIPVKTLAKAMSAALSEFGSVVSIKMQLHRALLYTLPISINAYNIWDFIGSVDKKMCVINQHSVTYAQAKCAVVCFDSAASINAVIRTTSVLKNHTLLNCSVNENVSPGGPTHRLLSNDNKSRLASIYARCSAPISHSVSFGGVSWANIVGGSSFFPLPMHNSSAASGSSSEMKPTPVVSMELNDRFAALECSLASFTECIDKLAKRLDSPGPINQEANIVMSESSGVVTGGEAIAGVAVFNFSVISKIEETLNNLSITVMSLSTKMYNAGLVSASGSIVSIVMETKLRSNAKFWIMNKFDEMKIFSSGLDKRFFGAGVAIIINNFFARYVFKVKEVSGHLTSVWLFFKGKLSVVFLGLYADASAKTRFGQACEINSLIAKAANFSIFVVLSGNFNKDRYKKSTSFKFCLDLELVNFFSKHSLIKTFTWGNFQVTSVSDFFNTDYNAILVSIGLDGFLNAWLNGEHKQTNKNREHSLDKFLECINMFNNKILKEVVTSSADSVFSKHWFSEFNCLKNKQFSKFFKLELLVAKLVRCLSSDQKSKASKYYEFRVVRDILIRKTIDRHMETFSFNKRHMIKSVLDRLFKKVVLDHLIINDELILKPKEVKSAVNSIMEGWTRKWVAPISLPVCWSNQYGPLDYVSDNAFSNIMNVIRSDEFLLVVKRLPNRKAAGIFGIPNKLWKHRDAQILGGLLDILNVCLKLDTVSLQWRQAWISMILKPYNWKGTLTNTKPIALVETARKILSKVLSDKILLAYSKFNVLHGNNFLVLKGMSTQTPIFIIGFIIKDALEKNRKLWLNSLVRIKMCSYFIKFFGNIHNSWTNQVMTDFGLTNRYTVHDELDQEKSSKTFFFATGAFVDNTIWVKNCLVATQCILNIASDFFLINDIAINTDKRIAIPINQEARKVLLSISGSKISIAKKDDLAKAYLDVKFFSNVVLRKAITKKQFLYLVSANLLASLVKFVNTDKILSELFEHRAMELQTTNWMFWHLLKFPIKLLVNSANCFLAGVICTLKLYNLLLSDDLFDVFWTGNSITVLDVLSFESYLGIVKSLKRYDVVFANQFLDHHSKCFIGLVSAWFASLVKFIINGGLSNSVILFFYSIPTDSLCDFGYIGEHLLNSGLGSITIYTDNSIKNLGSLCVRGSVAAYFLDVDTNVEIKMDELLLLTLVKIQAIALALECVSVSQLVDLYTDSQALLELCKFTSSMAGSDFHDKCWIEKEHIYHVIIKKGLLITWNKVKGHFGVVKNEHINFYANAAVISKSFLPLMVPYHFLNVEGRLVSKNACYVAKKLFNTVHSYCINDTLIILHESAPSLLANGQKEKNLLGTFANGNVVADLLNEAASFIDLFTALAKNFVLKNWVVDMLGCLDADSGRGALVVNFVCYFAKRHRSVIWLPVVELRSYYKKYNLLPHDGSFIPSVSGLSLLWSAEIIQNFGFRLDIHMCFGLYLCLTKSDFGFLCDVSVSKGTFHGPVGDFFSQKKKVILENIKHSDNKKNIFLSKSGPGSSIYSNVDSLSNKDKNVSMFDVNGESLLGLAATMSKVKHVNNSAVFGSLFSSLNFSMDNNKVVFPLCLSIFLDKKWIDPKIIKTPVEVLVKKSFALNINFSAIERKLTMAKTQFIRKLFSSVNGFEGATTFLKFKEIIKSIFTSEISMMKTTLLAKENGIIINKIFMDMPKKMIVTVVFKFGEIKSIKIQLIGIWQKAIVVFAKSGQAEHSSSGSGSSFFDALYDKRSILVTQNGFLIGDCLALLEQLLELLADQVLGIMYRLNSMELVLLVPVFQVKSLVVSAFILSMSDANMVLDVPWLFLPFSSPVVKDKVVDLGLSSLKVLTSKIGSLKSKIVVLEVSIGLILEKDMTNLAKQEDIIHWHKESGLYTGALVGIYFGQAANINFMVSKAINSSFFIILGGDFNENKSRRSASFKFYLGLGLINTFDGHSLAKAST